MFLNPVELESGLYGHVIDEITQDDRQIVQQAIDAAVEEIKSYLSIRYNTEEIFDAEDGGRNALVLENTKVVAIWNLIKLSSAETLYDVWRERYDRVVSYLTNIADGKVSPDLPLLTDASGEVVNKMRFGSHDKFEHYY